MDIKQLKYFIKIVENNCNLSDASKKVHVSQPALSKMIKSFEDQENIILFERSSGRLERLSRTGEIFYHNALEVIDHYDSLMAQLRKDSAELKGKIKIGIPPLILSTIFSEVTSDLILNNSNIKVELLEIGGFELRKSLILQEIDIAILLEPTQFNSENIETVPLVESELCAFMDQHNPLAKNENLPWSNLHHHPIAIFDDSFMIHHLLTHRFEQQNIEPDILITASNWDFLYRSTIGTDLITILPSPVSEFFPNQPVKKLSFDTPINWSVVLCRHDKRYHSRVEEYVFNYILDYFRK